jgi:hypothetical protein
MRRVRGPAVSERNQSGGSRAEAAGADLETAEVVTEVDVLPLEISNVLGHSSRSVTMDIYGHFLSTEGQGTPAVLARSYRGAGRRAPAGEGAAAPGDPLPAEGLGSDRQRL